MPFNEMYFQEKPKKPATPHSQEFLRKRKVMLLMPVVAIPFLAFTFYSLGGGQDGPADKKDTGKGFNTELPAPKMEKKPEKSKLELYIQADQDSIRRKEYMRQDPYYKKGTDSAQIPSADTKADELVQRLGELNQAMQKPVSRSERMDAMSAVWGPAETDLRGESQALKRIRAKSLDDPPLVDTSESDPQLEKLNGMLDKIIRIQHPQETGVEKEAGATATSVEMDGAAANSLPAVVQEDQILMAGATIALRLTEAANVNGVLFPKDQLVYGVVSLNNDRMLIAVNSIRREQSIYSTALQVYDLDGLPGVHIPGDLGREVAKESADQGIRSLNAGAFDPSLAGQAVNAGMLTARSLLSRKVRQVRVTVKAGYQVLLRGMKSPGTVYVVEHAGHKETRKAADSLWLAPDPSTFPAFMHRTVRHEKMELVLQGIYLRDSLLWLVLRLENHGPFGYMPEYMRWCIRDKRQARRTAMQEVTLQLAHADAAKALAGDSSRIMLTAFKPFTLPGDKELVLRMAEGNGARELVMKVGGKELLKAKRYEQE